MPPPAASPSPVTPAQPLGQAARQGAAKPPLTSPAKQATAAKPVPAPPAPTTIVLRYQPGDSQAPDKLAFLTRRLRQAGFTRIFSYPLSAYSRAVAVDYFFPQDRAAALGVIRAMGPDSPYAAGPPSRTARLVVRADGTHRHPQGTIEAIIP